MGGDILRSSLHGARVWRDGTVDFGTVPRRAIPPGGDSTVFTGWRFENRYKPLRREHWINPVLYLEYEDVNEASRIQKEIEGGGPDLTSSHRELAGERLTNWKRNSFSPATTMTGTSLRTLSWRRIFRSEGVEFGYAFGVSRPLARLASGAKCRFCRENFIAGVEMYGGLGSTLGFGPRGSAHYVAPMVSWAITDNSSLRFSTGFGLTDQSNPVLLRFGYSYEITGFGSRVSRLFGRKAMKRFLNLMVLAMRMCGCALGAEYRLSAGPAVACTCGSDLAPEPVWPISRKRLPAARNCFSAIARNVTEATARGWRISTPPICSCRQFRNKATVRCSGRSPMATQGRECRRSADCRNCSAGSWSCTFGHY